MGNPEEKPKSEKAEQPALRIRIEPYRVAERD
jgi:hypothetical protein